MNIETLPIAGAWRISGHRFADDRGWFQEWFKHSAILKSTGYDFVPVQTNISRSAANVVRGIHYSTAPNGQGKLVTVMNGEIDDYVIDLNPASATFGRWDRVRLSSDSGDSVLIAPHMGHAFQSLRNDTIVSYLVTAEFDPESEKGINPLCPTIGIPWSGAIDGLISPKDLAAPTLLQQKEAGHLPPF